MARSIHTSTKADISNGSILSVPLVDLYFTANRISFSGADHNITVSGIEYFGVGNLGEISNIEESTEIQGLSLNVSLSGVNPSVIPIALAENYQGKRATISILFLENDYTQIGDPVIVFDGLMDYMTISLGKDARVDLSLESKFAVWEKTKVSRYNSVDQRNRYPNDKGLDFIEQIENSDIPWGI